VFVADNLCTSMGCVVLGVGGVVLGKRRILEEELVSGTVAWVQVQGMEQVAALHIAVRSSIREDMLRTRLVGKRAVQDISK